MLTYDQLIAMKKSGEYDNVVSTELEVGFHVPLSSWLLAAYGYLLCNFLVFTLVFKPVISWPSCFAFILYYNVLFFAITDIPWGRRIPRSFWNDRHSVCCSPSLEEESCEERSRPFLISVQNALLCRVSNLYTYIRMVGESLNTYRSSYCMIINILAKV